MFDVVGFRDIAYNKLIVLVLIFCFISEYLMTGSPRTAGYPARSPMSSEAASVQNNR